MAKNIEYTITKSRRRHNIRVQVSSEGDVLVSAPSFLSQKEINAYLLEQEDWIEGQLKVVWERKKEEAEFLKENAFYYIGEGFEKVYAQVLKKEGIEIVETTATLFLKNMANEKLVLEKFYRGKGAEWIEKMKEKWYPSFINKPSSIKMRRQKSVWATCTPTGLIHLNIQLMKEPLEVFEYVFVHEMCHLIEANHSPNFWKTVEGFMPDIR